MLLKSITRTLVHRRFSATIGYGAPSRRPWYKYSSIVPIVFQNQQEDQVIKSKVRAENMPTIKEKAVSIKKTIKIPKKEKV